MSNSTSQNLIELLEKMNGELALRERFQEIVARGADPAELVQLGQQHGLSFTVEDVHNFGDKVEQWTAPETEMLGDDAPIDQYELDNEMLQSAVGGRGKRSGDSLSRKGGPIDSQGRICTISAECSKSGDSCWPFPFPNPF